MNDKLDEAKDKLREVTDAGRDAFDEAKETVDELADTARGKIKDADPDGKFKAAVPKKKRAKVVGLGVFLLAVLVIVLMRACSSDANAGDVYAMMPVAELPGCSDMSRDEMAEALKGKNVEYRNADGGVPLLFCVSEAEKAQSHE